MAKNIKIIDNILKFVEKNAQATDRALNRMSTDIERLSKNRVPVKKGPLKSSGKSIKRGFMDYRVVYNMEYAAFQEFGGDKKRVIKNYTTPGTGAFYLKSSGDKISEKSLDYLKQESARIKI